MARCPTFQHGDESVPANSPCPYKFGSLIGLSKSTVDKMVSDIFIGAPWFVLALLFPCVYSGAHLGSGNWRLCPVFACSWAIINCATFAASAANCGSEYSPLCVSVPELLSVGEFPPWMACCL